MSRGVTHGHLVNFAVTGPGPGDLYTSEDTASQVKMGGSAVTGAEDSRHRSRNDPYKQKARMAVRSAIRQGRLPKQGTLPCADCGGASHHYDHVAGYDPENALNVEPVCRPCHGKRGAARGEFVASGRKPGGQKRRGCKIGSAVTALRLARGWTLDDLASLMGRSKATAFRLETGADKFSLGEIKRVLGLLGTSLEEVLLK